MDPEEEQTVLFTIIPRSVTFDNDMLPVSVIVSPRLRGDDKLGSFPDWLNWTRTLRDQGLTLVIRCGSREHRVEINREVLRPDLWEQLFNKETFVRSYEYTDYSQHGIISYSVREVMSAIKTVYQEASIELALPDAGGVQEERQGNRTRLASMVEGLDVHWNGDKARKWREAVRRLNRFGTDFRQNRSTNGPLDSEGLIIAPRDPNTFQKAAVPFAVFHHMPTPDQQKVPLELDTDDVLDFHQALSSLNSYPALLRALGLVFDLELPPNFVAKTSPGKFGTLSVAKSGFDWQVATETPRLETAYVHIDVGQQHLFFTAPRILTDPAAPFLAVGLIDLNPESFGLAQVDVDGGMHKTMILAETLNNPDPERNLDTNAEPEAAPHPEIFDRDATLPSLRSGGISLYANRRGLQLLDTMLQSKGFNDAVESGGAQKRPFFAEDLLRGYRIDVWDSHTAAWHSLHNRVGKYQIGELPFAPGEEEGFVQTAAMQPAPGAEPDAEDLYLHEVITRWAGWSLSVPMPGKHLSRYGDPSKAVPPDQDPNGEYAENQPDTPFKMTVDYQVGPGSLPRLVFGRNYRLRARTVDLAGNSLTIDDPLTTLLSLSMALPRDLEGQPYLRYEPVVAPLVIMRDPQAVTSPGSAVDRLVIRTTNDGPDQDTTPADTTAADRHLVPPRTSVEMGERLGMFDDAGGRLKGDAATWQLIAQRDAGEFAQQSITIAGQTDDYPIEAGDRIDTLPHLPDPLSHGAALRDLPGTTTGSLAHVAPGAGPAAPIAYGLLSDPNPRPGSATLIDFNAGSDWQTTAGIRLTLAEPQPGQTDLQPSWDPVNRLLTVFLPKGETAVVPLSSYLTPDSLKLMGQWSWLRQYIELLTVFNPQPQYLQPGAAVDKINHILQRAVEGGHWMISPPQLLTLVHAVQQPLGRPAFTALNAEHDEDAFVYDPLFTAPLRGSKDPVDLAPLTAWRRPGSTDAFLMGALQIHGASTVQVDLEARWDEPVDNENEDTWQTNSHAAQVETLPLPTINEGYLKARGREYRNIGYYDPEHDQIAFVRQGDRSGPVDDPYSNYFSDAAPRHQFNDTKRRRVYYTARATSRYQEYFPADQDLDFTRSSEPVLVDVPATARPLAPSVAYVLPTFGWQRQTDTNLKRSVRFGGGLRVYLHRPWFSSGEGELLGVALWNYQNGSLTDANRDKFKPFITQWGMDPIWKTADLSGVPATYHFPDKVEADNGVSLEEKSAALSNGDPGRIDVAGFPVVFDPERKLWYADLTIQTNDETYAPFVRLALVRYQPHALEDAQVSRVVLADFAQLTPDRSALITADPHHPRTLRLVISGVAPRGPRAVVKGQRRLRRPAERPTQIRVRVQERQQKIESDLNWRDVSSRVAEIRELFDGPYPNQPDLEMWTGTVTFSRPPQPGRYRLLIEEYEYISANYVLTEGRRVSQPGRLIYAETIELDDALVG